MIGNVPANLTVGTVRQANREGVVFERHSGVDNRTPIGSAVARRVPMGMGQPASLRPAPFSRPFSSTGTSEHGGSANGRISEEHRTRQPGAGT